MNLIYKYIDIATLVIGLIYIVLEIKQKKEMWLVGIVSSLLCAGMFAMQKIYASMLLNIYYIAISIVGFYKWKKDELLVQQQKIANAAERLKKHDDETRSEDTVILKKINFKELLLSLLFFLLCCPLLYKALLLLNGEHSLLDTIVSVLSIIGCWWLAKAYYHHWLIWIIADIISAFLCLKAGMYWMSGLYLAYCLAAIYGLYHWKSRGTWESI